ncbi:unnamed protein product [Diplocarpon coronariae]|uniref:Dihydroorotate dehydrogenase family protein n=1 Tax=Diplocarpon coronariae TaxID=2795749 RepID=A0A218ZBN3_9HELO|nr:dihydroorotate dehydrogenase family protein [Marssonina coronariae]
MVRVSITDVAPMVRASPRLSNPAQRSLTVAVSRQESRQARSQHTGQASHALAAANLYPFTAPTRRVPGNHPKPHQRALSMLRDGGDLVPPVFLSSPHPFHLAREPPDQKNRGTFSAAQFRYTGPLWSTGMTGDKEEMAKGPTYTPWPLESPGPPA